MKAIILAAGEGTRLRPYTDNKPKCMVEINGVSMIDRQIKVLNSFGIEEIIIIGGYKSEMLHNKKTNLILNERFFETNMVWTLFCGDKYINGELIVSYGDIVYSPESLKNVLNSKADISVAILTSNNTQNKRILYKGCNPTSLSGLQLTSIASSVEYLTFNASFVFTGFEFKG